MVARQSVAIVAEKENFFNAGLAALLKDEIGFQQVFRTSDYQGLLDLLDRGLNVDLLAIDFELPGSAGLSTIRSLRSKQPDMRIAVLCDQMDSREVLAVLSAGAHGFIPKQFANCEELQCALRTVDEAGIFVPASLIGCAATESTDENEFNTHAFAGLTSRQQQVVSLLFEGYPNKIIARELGISPSTVKVHVHAAFRTLGVHSRLAAMAALRPLNRTLTEA